MLFCLSLISCGAKAAKPTYIKEFSYLPVYSNTMTLQSFTPPSQTGQDFGTGKYTIVKAKSAEVLQNYEEIFKKDGWSIYEDHKPYSIGFEKSTHYASIVPQQSGNDVILTVISK